ncbi:MAG: DeoR/GlpR family DNA-binding transcription regulator [Clostridiales bacterium]|nr:DeoR/GlpR family DNA-binding transcription regulator [Clostridiales bacterium]
MLKEERQTLILNRLHTSGKVVVSKLAVELNVSEDTIRRDLLDLDQRGQVKRVFGGAIPLERPVISYFDRESADVELKQRLAEKALTFLKPEQLVAIDGSSFNLHFAKNIPNHIRLTVLTNSYSIAHACSMKEQVDVIVLGGRLLKDSMTNVGETATRQAALYHPDLCFMGVYAIHPEYGMTIPYPDEVSVKSQLIQSSRRVIALVNPIKLNTVSRYHVCGIEAFTTLVTDESVSGEMAADYRNRGLDFI